MIGEASMDVRRSPTSSSTTFRQGGRRKAKDMTNTAAYTTCAPSRRKPDRSSTLVKLLRISPLTVLPKPAYPAPPTAPQRPEASTKERRDTASTSEDRRRPS